MSTRCNIVIKQNEKDEKPIYLYHHFDGYPEGVGAALKKYLSKLYSLYPLRVANCLVKCEEDRGYEITSDLHNDIEYYYVIHCDERKMMTYERYKGGFGSDPRVFKLINVEDIHYKLNSKDNTE